MPTFAWFTSLGVSCDWDCHRARGSLGGEDRPHRAGSPILAPYDCTVTYGMYNDGASYVQFRYANGYAHRAIHVQRSGRVREGQAREGVRCALSDGRKGTYGAGTSTGAHIHFHGIDPHGNRIPWEDVPPPYTLTGIESDTKEEEDDMYSETDRTRDVQTHQAIWNDTRKGGDWPGILERLERLEADHRAAEYTLDGKPVPAEVSAAQGGPRKSYWRELGRLIANKLKSNN